VCAAGGLTLALGCTEKNMGILTELFVAEPADAENYTAVREGSTAVVRYTRVQLGGLHSLHFSTLWALIESEKWDVNKHDLPSVLQDSNTWLFRFPEQFTRSLSELDERHLEEISGQWARTEEMRCDPADARYVLDELQGIAEKATASGKGLYLWCCL
jgi:hypothetical protein